MTWASGVTVGVGDLRRAAQLTTERKLPAAVVGVDVPGKAWSEVADTSSALRAGTRSAQLSLGVPVTMGGTALRDVAAGRSDAHWQALGRSLAKLPQRPVVRLTSPADADPEQARQAWRRAAGAIRATGNGRPILEWAAPVGTAPADAAKAYPGSDVVDVVGVTIHTRRQPWTEAISGSAGVHAWSTWAAQQGKRIAVHWSLDTATSAEVALINDLTHLGATAKRVAYETTASVGAAGRDATATYLALWSRR